MIRESHLNLKESRSAYESPATVFPPKLTFILEGIVYCKEQLHNCDETSSFAKMLSDKIYIY